MREIKFRAWHEKLKRMIYSIEVCDSIAEWVDENGKGWCISDTLMQYTGLKDKNGKEVYEGDIIGFNDGKINKKQTEFERYIVKELGEWCCTCGDYYCSQMGMGFYIEGFHGYHREDGTDDKYEQITTILNKNDKSEVIGNIYENPELARR